MLLFVKFRQALTLKSVCIQFAPKMDAVLCTKKKNACNQNLFGKLCGTSLGYETNLAHSRRKWKPYKKYHSHPPSAWLRKLYSLAEFNALLQTGTDDLESDFIEDVYDGRIWKEFASTGFFNSKYNVGLMLYVDWFKPFKRSEYKVAALMLTVLNLPRCERFKKKWTIIAGLRYN